MITKKTKLLSAIVAVVMLISMFAVFAMPAMADEELDLEAAKLLYHAAEVADHPGESAYQVSSPADLDAIGENPTPFGMAVDVYITADIDLSGIPNSGHEYSHAHDLGLVGKDAAWDTNWATNGSFGIQSDIFGLGHTITGINLPASNTYGWLDAYHGSIKDITFKNFTAKSAKYNCLLGRMKGTSIENVTFDGMDVIAYSSSNSLFGDRTHGNFAIKNLTVKNSKFGTGESADSSTLFLLFGSINADNAVTVDGFNLINNKTYKNSGNYFGSLSLGGINTMSAGASLTMNDVVVFGNTYGQSQNIFATNISSGNGQFTLHNALIAGNSGMGHLIWKAANGNFAFTNVYTDLNSSDGDTANDDPRSAATCAAATKAGVASGAELYAFNAANGEEDADFALVADAAGNYPVLADAKNATVKKVTLVTDAEYPYYTDSNAKLIGTAPISAGGWKLDTNGDGEGDGETIAALPETFAADATYVAVGEALNITELLAQYEYWSLRDPAYYNTSGLAAKIARAGEILENLDADQAEANALAAELEAAKATFIASSEIPASKKALYPAVTTYTIANVPDWQAVSKNYTAFTSAMTIKLIDDIDLTGVTENVRWWDGVTNSGTPSHFYAKIDGQGNDVIGLKTSRWLGYYVNSLSIKDINFINCVADGNVKNAGFIGHYLDAAATYENLTFDNLQGTAAVSADGYQNVLVFGTPNGAVTLKNITLKNSKFTLKNYSNYACFGLLFCKPNKDLAYTVDGAYFYNNTIEGNVGAAVGLIAGEGTKGTFDVKNVAAVGNKIYNSTGFEITDGSDHNLLFGRTVAGSKLTNVIGANNTAKTVDTESTNTLVYPACDFATNGGALVDANAAIAAANAEAQNEALTLWAIKDGLIVPMADGLKAPYKVTFMNGEETVATFATNQAGKAEGMTDTFLNTTTWDYAGLSVDTVYTANTVIKKAENAISYAELQEIVDYYAARNTAYFAAKADLEADLAIANGYLTNKDAADQGVVDALVTKLETYKGHYATGVNAPAASAADLYPGALDFTVGTLADLESLNSSVFNSSNVTVYFVDNITVTAGSTANYIGGAVGNSTGFRATIKGEGHTITGITLPATATYGWLDLYHGNGIYDLTFKNFNGRDAGFRALLMRPKQTDSEEPMVIENVTFDGADAFFSTGGFFGDALEGDVNMKNITIKNSKAAPSSTSGGSGVFGYLLAQTGTGYTLNVDGLEIVNNTLSMENGGYFSDISELIANIKDEVTIKNFVHNNNKGGQGHSLLWKNITDTGSLSIENAMIDAEYNPGWNAPVGTLTLEDVYVNDIKFINNDSTNTLPAENYGGTTVAKAALFDGSAAYALNANNADEATDWAVKEGTIVKANATDKAPVKVTITLDYVNAAKEDVTVDLYTDAAGKLIADESLAAMAALASDWSADLTGTFAADTTVTGSHTCSNNGEWTTENGVHSKVCSCGEVFESGECEYDYVPPVTAEAGSKHTKECTVCHDIVAEEDCTYVLVPNHEDAQEGTCLLDDVKVYACDCSATYKVTTSAPGHDVTMTHEGDTLATSVHKFVCANENCDDEDNTWTEACTAADFETETHDADCVNPGRITYTCKVCAAAGIETVFTDVDPEAPALGHLPGEWKGSNGTHTKTCTRPECGEVVETGTCQYDFAAPATPAAGTEHTKTCTICSDSFNESCNYVLDPNHAEAQEGTCEKDDINVYVCDGCEAAYKVISSAPGHDVTMTHEGDSVATSAHRYVCSNANCDYENNTLIVPCTEDDFDIAKTDADCLNAGTITYTCKFCTETEVSFTVEDPNAPALGHDWGDWYTYEEPTDEKDGEMRRDCERDDCDVFDTKPISKDSPRLQVVGGEGFAGEKVDVEINVANITENGLTGLTVKVDFDATALALKEIAAADGTTFMVTGIKDGEDQPIIDLDTVNGTIKISAASVATLVGDGDIFVLTFEIKEGTAEGEYDVTAAATDIANKDAADPDYALRAGAGKVTVVDYMLGDVNKDGKVSIADAVCLARYHANVEGYTTFDLNTMDCDGDGDLTTADITYLMWYLNGWVNELG